VTSAQREIGLAGGVSELGFAAAVSGAGLAVAGVGCANAAGMVRIMAMVAVRNPLACFIFVLPVAVRCGFPEYRLVNRTLKVVVEQAAGQRTY
jgi:hypothetical protein